LSEFEDLLSKLLENAPELSRSVIEERIAEKKKKKELLKKRKRSVLVI